MAVSITVTVSDADAQRVLTALGYDAATDGPPVPFVKSKIADLFRSAVRAYEQRSLVTTLDVS